MTENEREALEVLHAIIAKVEDAGYDAGYVTKSGIWREPDLGFFRITVQEVNGDQPVIAELITDTFMRIGHTWKIGGKDMQPAEEEVQIVLDEAAKKLYDGAIGDRLEIGGLIVEKRTSGLDVYIYIGSYE